ncbi:hypothetical protein GCM10011369_23150 [Neiella marina]|uniref:KilA-N domain-containing protein n=1 Tax=Neiella marina TaxID=508461 RepID=A0A8J2XPX7_9GAMM|nr:KilA-N domain-containing protein [Neiella marina]GGA80591.1 hypothetical protein GCM10011369_23150 [Neiella marina]
MANLSILSKPIRLRDGLYSLNDVHKAAGYLNKQKPSLFLRNEHTKDLITEIEGCTDLCTPLKTVHGIGTFVSKELVYAYAMWISPKFHLQVIRAFDAMISQQQPQLPPSQTDPEVEKQQLLAKIRQPGYLTLSEMVDTAQFLDRTIIAEAKKYSRAATNRLRKAHGRAELKQAIDAQYQPMPMDNQKLLVTFERGEKTHTQLLGEQEFVTSFSNMAKQIEHAMAVSPEQLTQIAYAANSKLAQYLNRSQSHLLANKKGAA